MEEWKDIKGYEGVYQVSNLGQVRHMAGQYGTALRKEKILKQSFTTDGYKRVRLMLKEKDKTRTVHRLVAEAFLPNSDPNLTVNHKDGDKANNKVENLEWIDRSLQMYHAYKLGLKKSQAGVDNCNAKLTAEQVKYIREHYQRHSPEFGQPALAKKFGVAHSVIGKIVRGKTYKNV